MFIVRWIDAAKFLTGASTVGSLAVPIILKHADFISTGTMLIEFMSFIIFLGTVMCYYRANFDDEWSGKETWNNRAGFLAFFMRESCFFVQASDDCNDQGMVSYIVSELQAHLGHMAGVHHLKQLNWVKLLSRKINLALIMKGVHKLGNDPFVVANFDGSSTTTDSETISKIDKSVREANESPVRYFQVELFHIADALRVILEG
ncbi:vacuolar protein sorting 55 (VPS55) family protein [Artemisia annua]|uniref:Vacuolar protein sorting 55 (VPS55) family protein n=1 Tax=Artemisia annua TaxID=35608 RepID=A0A2U1LN32_ARTAN|nr:vacuolar protein sorting 55 (VPS55) family protein [Artemisia annua]